MFFPKLRGVMAEQGVSVAALAEKTGIKYCTLSPKIRKVRPFTLSEAVTIKKALGTDMPIEELFRES